MDNVLGIDLGTSYFKLGIFNRDGTMCGLGRVLVPKDVGDGKLSEIPVDRFWKLLKQELQDACQQAKIRPDQINAIAYSSQANSFLLLDKNKNPLTPIILWNDNRAEGMKVFQNLFNQKNFLDITGLGIECSHQFCVSKIRWFQKYQPDVLSQTTHLMTISDFLTYSLTGKMVGDAGTASLLGLLNVKTSEWQNNIINLSHIKLSKPLLPGTVAGGISIKGSELLGLKTGIRIVVGSLDHHMAAIGSGVGYFADMSESTGTVLACLKFSTKFNPKKNICTGIGLQKRHFYQLTFDENGASALEWYQQIYAPQYSISELLNLAKDIDIGSERLIAKPNAQKHDKLSGFINRSSIHHHGHFVRAVLESTAASMGKLVRYLSDNILPKVIVSTGGGAESDLWLQIKSDLLSIELIRTNTEEPACRGAAMLASLAAGWYPDLRTVSKHWIKINKSFQPIQENHAQYLEWYKRIN